MLKKIPIDALKAGMYVHDTDVVWRVENVFKGRFKIGGDEQIAELASLGAREVYIDTDLGEDLPGAMTEWEAQQQIESCMQHIGTTGAISPSPRATPKQLAEASSVQQNACAVINTLMAEIRLGNLAALEETQESLFHISDSVFSELEPLLQIQKIDHKDHYTFQHSVHVCALLTGFSRALGLGREITRQIQLGGLLHDIGKAQIPIEILNKPGALSKEEFEIIKTHVTTGVMLVREVPWMSPIARQVVRYHHERFDGTGYPGGQSAGHIPIYGQMAAITDVYDAITTQRSYHQALPPGLALRKLQEWSKHHFNPELVAHFIRSIGIYPLNTLVRLESNRLGIVMDQNEADQCRPKVRIIFDTAKHCAVTPFDLDLYRCREDRIVGCEPPQRFGIDLEKYTPGATALPANA